MTCAPFTLSELRRLLASLLCYFRERRVLPL